MYHREVKIKRKSAFASEPIFVQAYRWLKIAGIQIAKYFPPFLLVPLKTYLLRKVIVIMTVQ